MFLISIQIGMELSVVETGSNKMVACENNKPEILFRLKSLLDILRCASLNLIRAAV